MKRIEEMRQERKRRGEEKRKGKGRACESTGQKIRGETREERHKRQTDKEDKK